MKNAMRFLLVLALVLMASVPVAAVGFTETDAADDSVVVLIPTTDVAIVNGESRDFAAYINNKSDNAVHITISTPSLPDISVECLEDGKKVDYTHIAAGEICDLTVRISAMDYAKSLEEQVIIKFDVMDLVKGHHVDKEAVFNLTVSSDYVQEGAFNKFFGYVPNTLSEPFNHPAVTVAVTFILWMVIAWVLEIALIPHAVRLIGRRLEKDNTKKVSKSLVKLVAIILAVVCLNECVQIAGLDPAICAVVTQASSIVYAVVGAYVVWRIYMLIVTIILLGKDNEEDGRAANEWTDTSIAPLLKFLGRLIITIAAVSWILASFGVDLNGILVSAGVISLGITLGAQNILSQFFSGLVILITRPFRPGDYLKINGTVYIVRKVRIMFTEFSNWDKDQLVTMPNNAVTSATIVNLTKEDDQVRIYLYMPIAYEADVSKAKTLMAQAAMEHPHVILDGTRSMPSTRMEALEDSDLLIRLACYVDSFDSSTTYLAELRERVYNLFLINDIEIPYTKMELTLFGDGKKMPWDKED